MRITDVKVGEEYKLSTTVWTRRGRVIEMTTVPVTRGYGWNKTTVQQKRAVVQTLNTDTGEPIADSRLLKLGGKNIKEPWADFAERHAEFLAKQREENEIEATVERALERVDVDATVRITHRYRNEPVSVVVTLQSDEAREWFLKVLKAAEPFVAELHEEEE